jgi:hypothetical protein
MTAYYVALGAVTAVVAVVVFSAGSDKHAQPSIAGGYDAAAPNECLGPAPPKPPQPSLPVTAPAQARVSGPSFDVKQSGEFVNFTNNRSTLGAKLRLEGGTGKTGPRKLSGDVSCVNGQTKHFVGTAVPGPEGTINGDAGRRAGRRGPEARPARGRRPEAAVAAQHRRDLQALAALDVLRRALRARRLGLVVRGRDQDRQAGRARVQRRDRPADR